MDEASNAADARHLQSICSGSEGQRSQAMREIDQRHRKRLERYFWRQGHLADAQDLAQQVLIKVLAVACQFLGTGAAAAWLLQIARTTMLNHVRSVNGRTEVKVNKVIQSYMAQDLAPDFEGLLPGMQTAWPEPSETVADQDLIVKVLMILRHHSPDHAEIIHQRAVEQMEYPDLAVMLNKKEGAVREHVSQARKMVKMIAAGLDAGQKPAQILDALTRMHSRHRSAA
jgi:RNA polymerase sigma factor (sigma-70 family)